MATPYTLDQYNALCAAYAQGVISIKYGDKEMTFRSRADMLATINDIAKQLFPDSKNVARKRFINYTKGYR